MSEPKPKRYTGITSKAVVPSPDGQYVTGIYNPQIAQLVGEIVGHWTHVEDSMIGVLIDLLSNDDYHISRTIFRSIIGNALRIKLMRTLLQRSAPNALKSEWYDEIIQKFQDLNNERNGFIHGLYTTHEGGTVYVAKPQVEGFEFFSQRLVTPLELVTFKERLVAFQRRIDLRHVKGFE